MRTTRGVLAATGVAILAAAFALPARAQCFGSGRSAPGLPQLRQQAWSAGAVAPASSLAVYGDRAPAADQDPIVGMWKIKMTSKGTPGTPDGTVIDEGYSQWHGDGTEIINSSRAPNTQSFCLGVWDRTGAATYRLNHFMISWNPGGTLVGPGNLRETITLSPGHNSFAGTFTIDQYDKSGHRLAHVAGVVVGSRLTVNTPAAEAILN